MGGLIKGALEIGGLRIIDRQLAVLRQIADPIFAVSSAAVDPDPALPVVRDRFPDHGVLGGIYTAIAASPHDRTLVVAGDLPFLTLPFLAYMASIAAEFVGPR